MTKLICKFCNIMFGIRALKDHLQDCILNYCESKNKSGYLIEFMAQGCLTNKKYSLFIIFGTKCKFTHICKLLKIAWCNCCYCDDHLTTINAYVPNIVSDDLVEISINSKSSIEKYEHVKHFVYTYNIDSPTYIYFRIIKKLNGIKVNTKMDFLYRNEEFNLKCKCKKEACCSYLTEKICMQCINKIKEPEKILLIKNSPCTGMCNDFF